MSFIPLQPALFRVIEDFANLPEITSAEHVASLFRDALPEPIPMLGFRDPDVWKTNPPQHPVVRPGDPPAVFFDAWRIREQTVSSCQEQQGKLRWWLGQLASKQQIEAEKLQEVTELIKDDDQLNWKMVPFFDGERFGMVTLIQLNSIWAACLLAMGQVVEHNFAHKVRYCALDGCNNFVLDVSARGRKARTWCSDNHGSRARQRVLRERRKKAKGAGKR
jgi:hypothetical protein